MESRTIYIVGDKDYLMHHGIKGQKWGVENGPPYPLNDTVKAIAYRGGKLKDGREATNFTLKDVKRARKIVNKNMKMMTEDDIREYKARLLLENEMGSILGTDTTDKLIRKLKDNAVDAAATSVKNAGTKVLTKIEVNAIGKAVETVFGPDVAAMVTNGLSAYDLKEKAQAKKKADRDAKLNERRQDYAEKVQAFNEEKWRAERADKNKSTDDSKDKSEETKKYETVDSEIIDDKYDNSDNSGSSNNGNYTYYYNPNNTRYESWNSEYLLPGSQETKSSKQSKKSKKRK